MTKDEILNIINDLEFELKACDADIKLIKKKREYIRAQIEIYTEKYKQDSSEYLMRILSIYNSGFDHLFLIEFFLDTRVTRFSAILKELRKELKTC